MRKTELFQQLDKTFSVFPINEYVEIRLLNVTKKGTMVGYFNNQDDLYTAIKQYDGKYNVFMSLNEIIQDVSARSANHLKEWAKETLKDEEVVRRRWILVDLDPVRPAGVSSTDEELEYAEELSETVKSYLSDYGFSEPVSALSGNGYHLLYPIDLPNDRDSAELIKKFLMALDVKLSTEKVKVDKTTYNAARITKLYGTMACKGDNTEERPHRRSMIIDAPETFEPVQRELIQQMIKEALPEEKDRQQKTVSQTNVNKKRKTVKEYLSDKGLEVAREKPYLGGTCYVLKRCPFNPEHTDTGAYVIEFPNGKITAGCHHDSCCEKGWADLLELYPDEEMNFNRRRQRGSAEGDSVVEIILNDIEAENHRFYHDRAETAYVCVKSNNVTQYMEVKGKDYKAYIRYLYYGKYGKSINRESLQQVLDTLEVKALNEGDMIAPAYRCKYMDGKIYYYLADREQSVICIDEDGYRILADAPIPFVKKQNMSEQVLPLRSKEGLRKLGMKYWRFETKDDRIMHWVILITRFISDCPLPIVYYFGDRGAAKTTTMRMDKMLVDPSEIDVKALPKSISDVLSSVANQYMVCFDNVSRISEELSDILCVVATNGYYSKRMLYSDNEECAIKLDARLSFSGITNLTAKPDLIDRMVSIKLKRIDNSKRRTEEEIMTSFKKDLPYMLDGIFRVLSKAVAIYKELNLESLPRMADFARWGYAVAEAMKYGGEKFLEIYEKNQEELLDDMVSEDTIATVLIEFVKQHGYFKGSVTDLCTALTAQAEKMEINTKIGWIKGASALSRKLYENQSVLSVLGITVKRGKTNGERYIELNYEEEG